MHTQPYPSDSVRYLGLRVVPGSPVQQNQEIVLHPLSSECPSSHFLILRACRNEYRALFWARRGSSLKDRDGGRSIPTVPMHPAASSSQNLKQAYSPEAYSHDGGRNSAAMQHPTI